MPIPVPPPAPQAGMAFAHGEWITVMSTTTTRDEYGDAVTESTQFEWGPCAVAPRYATESTDPRTAPVVVGKTVYGPTPPTPLDSDDVLLIDGLAYEIDGEPGKWRSPFTGWEPGVEVAVKRAARP